MPSLSRADAQWIMSKALAELDKPTRIALARDAVAALDRGESIEAWVDRVLWGVPSISHLSSISGGPPVASREVQRPQN